MESFEPAGHATPAEASCVDIPPAFVTMLGTRIYGDAATARLLTNDQPPFEDYQVNCVRIDGRWHVESGFPFNVGTPDEILQRARRLGWR